MPAPPTPMTNPFSGISPTTPPTKAVTKSPTPPGSSSNSSSPTSFPTASAMLGAAPTRGPSPATKAPHPTPSGTTPPTPTPTPRPTLQPSPKPTPQPTPKPTQVCRQPELTLNDVRSHGDRFDCWYALFDLVYDLTNYIDDHPGGSRRIFQECGTDATSAYSTEHDEQLLQDEGMGRFLIGKLSSRKDPC